MERLFRHGLMNGLIVMLWHGLAVGLFAAEWQGYEKQEFVVEGHNAFVVFPKAPAAGKPWIWRTEFFGHEPQADLALLGQGFHVAYVDVQNL